MRPRPSASADPATGWQGSLPHGGVPQQPGLSTLPRGMEQLEHGTFDSNPIDARGNSGFAELFIADVHHYTRGEIYVVADSVIDPAAGVFAIWSEVQVVALTGGVPDLLATAAVNSTTGPLKVQWGASADYNLVQVLTRQIVNAVPDNAIYPSTRLDLRAFGRLYR